MIRGHKADAEDAEFLKANKHIEKREFKKAEQTLRRGLKRVEHEQDPNGVGFYYQALGFLYLLQEKKGEALHFYQKADKASADHHAKLAYARLLTTIFGDHDAGLQKAKEALKLMPKGDRAATDAHGIMGLCFLGRGDRKGAIRAFSKRCVRYLADIKKKAGSEGNERLIGVVDGLLADAELLEQTSI